MVVRYADLLAHCGANARSYVISNCKCLFNTRWREVDPRAPPHLPMAFHKRDALRGGRKKEGGRGERETAIVIYAEVSEQLRWLCKILLIPVSEILSRSDTALRFIGTPSFLLFRSFFFIALFFLCSCPPLLRRRPPWSCSSSSSLAPLKEVVVRHAETYCARTTLLSKFRRSTPKKAYKHVICWWK